MATKAKKSVKKTAAKKTAKKVVKKTTLKKAAPAPVNAPKKEAPKGFFENILKKLGI